MISAGAYCCLEAGGVDSAGVVVYGGCRFSRCGGVWWV